MPTLGDVLTMVSFTYALHNRVREIPLEERILIITTGVTRLGWSHKPFPSKRQLSILMDSNIRYARRPSTRTAMLRIELVISGRGGVGTSVGAMVILPAVSIIISERTVLN